MYRIILLFLITVTLNVFSQKKDAAKLVASGMEAERTSNYTEALFYYSMAMDMDSKFADAYEKRGDLYKRLKNYGKAKQDYCYFLNLTPSSFQVWTKLGIMNYELTYYADAVSDFTKAMELIGEDADLYYFRGNAYNKNNEFEKAGKDYDKSLSLRPDYTEAREKLDKLYAENKITWKPEEITQNASKEEVKEEEPGKEVTIADLKETAEVNEQLKDQYASPSQNLQDLIFNGLALYEMKDFTGALKEYEKAVQLDPSFAEAYYHKGRAYTELGSFSLAIEEYSRTIELNPNHEKAYINRGFIYNELKEYNKAIGDFQRGIEINPNSINGYYNMGIAYYGLGNKAKMVECLQAAARLGDSDSKDWLRSNGHSW